MENQEDGFSEIVQLLKSLIPWGSKRTNVSRDFWMPDESCRVCYTCDVEFGFFNRKHHCRLCGRIFCATCTTHRVPMHVSFDDKNCRDERDRIRVCNFCFKQWNEDQNLMQAHETASEGQNEFQPSIHSLSPSHSTASLLSTKSTFSANVSNTTGSSLQSTLPNQLFSSHGSGHSPNLSIPTESDRQELLSPTEIMDSISDIDNYSPKRFGYCTNRCDARHPVSDGKYYHQSSDYHGQDDYDKVDDDDCLHVVHSQEKSIDAKLPTSPIYESPEYQSSIKSENIEKVGLDHSYDCNPISPTGTVDKMDSELVDFENNGMLWLPPSPLNAVDEEVISVNDEEKEENAAGEFSYTPSFKSFGRGESQNRIQSTEEHKVSMKNVVVGHFRALVTQLLQVEDLPIGEENDKENWLEIITSLSWEVATLLKPDTSKGGGMDPGGYTKIKCLSCGRRSDSFVVKGVVLRKNLAHRRMKSRIEKPRLLLLGGDLEYQRVSNHLSSFDTLLQQEMDHLKMAVAKISAHHPDVLLVENSVSRFAQDYLLAKNISLVLNVKKRRLKCISHCTGSPIVPSIDILTSQKLGTCDLFHVEKFYEGLSSSGQIQKSPVKNLMFFEGCPKPLGCTVLLMGANSGELKKVKRVLQYGVFAAYHLALETSFFADEGASLPELSLKSPINAALPEKPSDFGHSISTISGFTISSTDNTYVRNIVQIGNKIHSEDPNSMACSTFNVETTLPHISYQAHDSQRMGNFHYSVSSFNDLRGLAENNFCSKHFAQLQSSIHFPSPHLVLGSDCCDSYFNHYLKENNSTVENFQKNIGITSDHEKGHNFIVPVSCNVPFETVDGASFNNVNPKIAERRMVGDLIDPYLGTFEDNSHIQEQESPFKDDFPPSPSDHQSFLVSLSIRCVWKGIVCEQAHLLRIKYYGGFDKPLGRFLRDDLFDKYYQCRSCELPSEAHVHCYNHKQGNLTISVKKISEVLSGEHDGKIWMWHSCLRCPREEDGNPPRTLRVVMSDAAWGLSFGKFLELSFCNHTAASRVASCGHSLQRDCLRFYGFGQMVACFRYASVDIHSVYLPPSQLDFSTTNQDWIKNGLNEVTDKAEILFTGVLNAISQISEIQMNTQSMGVLEKMLHEEKSEFEEYLYNIMKKEAKENLFIDVLDINKLHRRLFFHSYLWDQRLIFAASLAGNSQENLCSIEKLIDYLSSQSPGFSTSDSLSLETIDNDQPVVGVCQVDQVGELCIPQSLQNLDRQKIETCQYSKCRNEIRSCYSSPIHQFDQSSSIAHRSFSEGDVSYMSDTLDAKWTGDNANTLTVSEDLEENCGFYRDRYLTIPQMTKDDDVAVGFFRWSDLPFQTVYQFIFERIFSNASLLNIVIDHTPVYVSRFCELTDNHGTQLMLPLGIDDIDVPIYDDEPSSIISFALITSEYDKKLDLERERLKDCVHSFTPHHDSLNSPLFTSSEDSINDTTSGNRSSMEPDQQFLVKAENIKVSFTNEGPFGKVNYTVTCYCAVHFDVLRKICCPSKLDFVRSLRRCKKWGAQGGKSNVFFAKSLDDRFIIKQVTKTELDSFLDFGTKYFKYLCESISSRSPTCLAKVLGIYQVTTKYLKSGKEIKIDLLVMENLLCGKNITRLYDLKGSSRSRYNADSSGNNKVLLDQNLIEAIPTSPIFIGNKAKRLLERAVWNDTAFLASVHVMDYSLLVGVDEQRHELVLGIIDFMRQYTWDKHLESCVKTTGILGGSNALPTVVSPQQYKKRFRKAMSAYFLMVPDQWSPPTIIPSMSQSDFGEDNTQLISPKS